MSKIVFSFLGQEATLQVGCITFWRFTTLQTQLGLLSPTQTILAMVVMDIILLLVATTKKQGFEHMREIILRDLRKARLLRTPPCGNSIPY